MSMQEAERRIAECRQKQNPKLDLASLDLVEVPPSVFGLTHLRSLNLSGWSSKKNRLVTLPNDIAQLTNLQILNLSSNRLSYLPDAITQLTNLEVLDLSGNRLNGIPEALACLNNLTELYLNGNQLRSLSDGIMQLKKLQRLDLGDNQLSALSAAIVQLTELLHLSLSGNRLSTLPESVTKLSSLQRLNLSNTQLESLPSSLALLTKLQRLYLGDNQLKMLPNEIMQLTCLQILDLYNNQLSTLPKQIVSLTSLQRLYLGYNQLRTLPESITCLVHLERLYLQYNQLSSLPSVLTQLTNLQNLDLRGNPLLDPPIEVASQGISAIRAYFAERSQIPTDIGLYESKLLLVGEGRVGKTSLSKALRIPDYQLEDEQSTEGIDIQTWTIPKAETGLEQDFRLNVWDFGGQEIYHATHQFFLTRRSLYLLVTESRREDKHDDFYYWFNIIRLLGDNAPVVVVLNKCDQPTKELPIEEYRKTFGNIVHYDKVSCATGHEHRIEGLKQAIRRILTDKTLMPHVGDRLPAIWLRIREDLATLRGQALDYIPYQQFLDLCAQHQMVEPERINLVAGYFHDLGIFLHFRDDWDLHDTVILNHEWVTVGVYKVLDNETVKAQQGRFTDADLLSIWAAATYRDKRRELLALMKNTKFELCYELPPLGGQRQGYIAPQLLPVDEIAYEWRTDKDNLRFEYRYDFMPKGILSRFIVKRHREIVQATDPQGKPKQVHWRYGVLLEWENTRALVRERYFERKITIVLEGDNKIGFLAIIRRTIEEIHGDFHNLAVHEMVPCSCAECRQAHKPHFFRHELLQRYLRKGVYQARCEQSLDEVDVRAMLREAIPAHERELGDVYINEYYAGDHVGGDKIGGSKVGGDLIDVGGITDAAGVAIGKGIEQVTK